VCGHSSGSGYSFTYDGQGQILTVTDLTGRTIETHAYEGDHAVTSERADGRERLTFEYHDDVAYPYTVVTDASGAQRVYWYSEDGNGFRHVNVLTGGTCPTCGQSGGQGSWWRDARDRVVNRSWGDSPSSVATYTYDDDDNPTSVTKPLGRTWTYTYDPQGRVLTRVGPDSAQTTYTYGPAGPLTVTDPLNQTTTTAYGPTGLITSVTNAEDETTTFDYNESGDLTSLVDAAGNTTAYGYDAMGRRTSVTDPHGKTTTITYDAAGNVTGVTAPDGSHTDVSYDAGGRRTSTTDPLGHLTRYGYDPSGLLATVLDPSGGSTRYDHDPTGRLAAVTDARGNATRFEYDEHGHVRQVTYPDAASEVFSYDGKGRLDRRTDRKGVVTEYQYDDADRLVAVRYSDGTSAVRYTYDQADRLLAAANGTDTLTWSYDAAGQVLSEASAKNGTTVTYAYDRAGRRRSVSLNGSTIATYSYDKASRLSTLTHGASTFAFGYTGYRRSALGLPNGVATAYTYDDLSRLLRITATRGGSQILDVQYTYDPAGNRTTRATPDLPEAFGYDVLSRLTAVDRTAAGASSLWRFDYDAVGNRTTLQFGNAVTSAAYDSTNRLLTTSAGGPLHVRGVLDEAAAVTVNGQPASLLANNAFEAVVPVTSGDNTLAVVATDASGNARTNTYQVNVDAAGATYTYDARGNLASRTEGGNISNYEWNARNELTRVTKDGAELARSAYDPLGRRVEKVVGDTTTSFLYDGSAILRETRSDGTAYTYVHGPGIDEPLARIDQAGTSTYYHADGLGSIVKMTDASANAIQTRQYDAWGNLEQGADQPGYAFTGREWDPETNLYYYRARYYDPKIGRFVSEDPMGFMGGLNFHAYALDNPVRYVDPYGLRECTPEEWDAYQATLQQCVEGLIGSQEARPGEDQIQRQIINMTIGGLIRGAATPVVGSVPGAALGAILSVGLDFIRQNACDLSLPRRALDLCEQRHPPPPCSCE
jgi:RHS repeat-associated protein